ncbi:MAG: hypothetical protein AABW48_02705 [Nanoarchaeota archaeon]
MTTPTDDRSRVEVEDSFKLLLKQIPPSPKRGDLVTYGQIANAFAALRGKKEPYQELSQEEIRRRDDILNEAYGKRAIIRTTSSNLPKETEGILRPGKFIHYNQQGTIVSQIYFSPIDDLILIQRPDSPDQAYIFEAEKGRPSTSEKVGGLAGLVAKYHLHKAGVAKPKQD